ncbi:hypothetical protein OTU49_012208 [Cherax quadricarinatus]|uniref:Uncharacterized protein n=1 Tax=Cherax quadricarinatus TaxID=27406 RepID=A0AAW0Y5M0_CHEQU
MCVRVIYPECFSHVSEGPTSSVAVVVSAACHPAAVGVGVPRGQLVPYTSPARAHQHTEWRGRAQGSASAIPCPRPLPYSEKQRGKKVSVVRSVVWGRERGKPSVFTMV